MQNELSESLKVKEEVDEKSTSLRDVIDNHGAELKSLENELEGISKVERLINEYVSDYEQKVREIEKYIEKSDDELVSLRESAESLYLKKYLGELETMTENYTAELEGAINAEHDIEQKIKDSKSRMIELIKVSQDLVKKLRSDTNAAAQYETLDQIVRERTAKMKSLVAEKEAERQSLIEESRGSRKSSAKSVSKSKDGPVASSVSSKSKKKKKNEEEE
jgi:chromosome segregation ATPase